MSVAAYKHAMTAARADGVSDDEIAETVAALHGDTDPDDFAEALSQYAPTGRLAHALNERTRRGGHPDGL